MRRIGVDLLRLERAPLVLSKSTPSTMKRVVYDWSVPSNSLVSRTSIVHMLTSEKAYSSRRPGSKRWFASSSSSNKSDDDDGSKKEKPEKSTERKEHDGQHDRQEAEAVETPGPFTKVMETQYVWGFFSNFAREIIAGFNMVKFYVKRNGKTPQELLTDYGFNEDEFYLGSTVAYTRIAQVFRKGEPRFRAEHSDMVDGALADMLDTQLQWYKTTGRVPKLVVSNINAKLLYLDRGVPFEKMKVDEWVQRAKESKDKGEEFVFENVVPTILYAHVLFEADEHFEWISAGDADKDKEAPKLSRTKHIAMFTADVPLRVEHGKEADHIQFKMQRLY